MQTTKLRLYFNWLKAALVVWVVVLCLPRSVLSSELVTMLSCVFGLLFAPALAGVLVIVCLLVGNLRPKTSLLAMHVGEVLGQFAVSIDDVLNIIPGNPFAYGRTIHMHYLAIVLSTKQNYKEAKVLIGKVIALVEKEEGPHSVSLIEPLGMLNSCLRGLGEYDESSRCTDRLLVIAEQNKGASLSMVGAALADVCVTYSKQGRIKESEEVGEKAIRLLQQVPEDAFLDNSSALVAIAMNNLGAVYSLSCKYDRAFELFKRSLELKKRVMREGDSSIGESYGNVACALLIQEKYEEALENANMANEIFEANGPRSSWAIVQQIMGDAYRGLGNLVESESKLTKAISVQEELFAPGDPSLADTYRDLGKLYRDKGEYTKAQEYFSKALSIFENSVGVNHPQISRTLEECCKLYEVAGKESELSKATERIAEISQHQI